MLYTISNILIKVNLRLIILTAVTILMISLLSGAYLENIPVTLTQPDGSKIECFASGDEYYNYAHDKDGYTVIVGEDGYYYYGIEEGDYVVPSNYRVDHVNPTQVRLSPGARISERLYQERRARYDIPFERDGMRAPHTGTINNIVIYIRFDDEEEFSVNRSIYDDRFNEIGSRSVRDYFLEVSYEKLDIISHHFPPSAMDTNLSYEDEEPRSYFQPYHVVNNPNGYRNSTERRLREHALLVRAVEAVRDDIPKDLDIDADNDGRVDSVSFVIKGDSGAWADLLWAHRWVLYSYDVRIHGKRVYDYTFQPENQSNASTLSHEMFHTLGAPDLYRYSYDGFVPVGPWDLMASGFTHMGAWMKYKYANENWIEHIPEINSSGTYSLKPLTSKKNNSYYIRSPYSNRQFFVLEYRRREGLYESRLPGSGLLVYRINSGVDGNASGPPDEVYIFRPNGTNTNTGIINLAHYNSQVDRTAINDYDTNPVSFLANGSPGGLSIHNISAAGDSISFSVTMIGDLVSPILDRPVNFSTDVDIMPTFEWGYVNVADYYSLQVAKDSLFKELIVDEIYITETEYTLDKQLELEESYYWRVSSSDDEETSDWSDAWVFTVSRFSPLDLDITGASYGSIAWADFNNNGYLDLIMTGNNRTVLYENKGNGNFVELEVDLPLLRRSSLALGDLNNNGYFDIVLTGHDPQNVPRAHIIINEGNYNFKSIESELNGVYNSTIALGDYNNNGFLDIFIAGESQNILSATLYENSGKATFSVVDSAVFPGFMYGDASWGDFNNNGKLDIAITGTTLKGAHTDIYYNVGNGSFSAANTDLTDLSGSSLSVGDFNNNGYQDIVISGISPTGAITEIYENNGEGSFAVIDSSLTGTALGDIHWGDFNMNGYLDILLTGSNTSQIYRNINGNSFSKVVAGLENMSFSSASWGDFDNDGDLDIAIIGSALHGSKLFIYRNNEGSNKFTPNNKPTTPQNLKSIVNDCSVTFLWDESTDLITPTSAITYNISIGTQPGQEDYFASMSDLKSGFRKIPARGNVGSNNQIVLHQLPKGTYYWRVQAIDGSFVGSNFTDEKSFKITTVSGEETATLPSITHLGSNYPNPFNPRTTIFFSLSEKQNVKLDIFNILGQKVTTLIDEELNAGQHSVIWDTETESSQKLSSGIYLYRMKANNFIATEKMLLLK